MKKIAFEYWPRESCEEDHFFKNFLKKSFDVRIVSKKEADILFFSVFKDDNKKMPKVDFNGKKVFWTGENIRINMSQCDFAFGFDYEERIKNKNYLRLPLYVYFGAGQNLIKKGYSPQKILFSKKYFCNYIYSKDAKERVEFFNKLDKYKKVNAPGKSMNNSPPIPTQKFKKTAKLIQNIESLSKKYVISSLLQRHFSNWRQGVINYQKDFKFSIAFENSSFPGYTTEKIYHPMLANSIPIYWGNPEINKDFNTKSFINYHNYNDTKKVIDKIIDLDINNKKYLKMLKEPWLKSNKQNKWMDKKRIKKQFEKILD
jgi:alpha(1,3/1,4) fucosyltransferase